MLIMLPYMLRTSTKVNWNNERILISFGCSRTIMERHWNNIIIEHFTLMGNIWFLKWIQIFSILYLFLFNKIYIYKNKTKEDKIVYAIFFIFLFSFDIKVFWDHKVQKYKNCTFSNFCFPTHHHLIHPHTFFHKMALIQLISITHLFCASNTLDCWNSWEDREGQGWVRQLFAFRFFSFTEEEGETYKTECI